MRDRFASVGAVIDHEAETASEVELAGYGAGSEQKVAEDGLLIGVGFADAGDDGFGNDEQVDRRGRCDIVNDDAEIVLVLDFSGDFAGDDAFEKGRHFFRRWIRKK